MEFKSKNNDYFNTELEFGIKLNLAIVYEHLKLYDESKQIYQEILQQDNYFTPGIQFQRVRVNLGNLYYKNSEYKKAITEWKRAVDKINKDNKELRANILRNIANAYIRLSNYNDAIDNYAESMKLHPNVHTAMNLLLCDLVVDKIEHTKNVFNVMLDVAAFNVKLISKKLGKRSR
jgi:intraflagellar transport protein 88